MTEKIAIIGAGGFGREVLDLLDTCNSSEPRYDVLGFIVQEGFGDIGATVNGKPILGYFEWIQTHPEVLYTCAVGAPHHRRRLVNLAHESGARFATLIHPAAMLGSCVSVGQGSIITAGCILTCNIRVGSHVHVNLSSTVGHDVILNDFVTLSPGAHISGNVTLSEGVYVGTGASVIEKVNIGQWSTLGAGAVAIRDLPRDSTAVGVPAKVIKTREVGWHEDHDSHNT